MTSARWAHAVLSAYMWAVLWLPVDDWNRQQGGPWLWLLMQGSLLTNEDLALLALVTLPTLLCFAAWRTGSARFLTVALVVDGVWLGMEMQARWIPYALGTVATRGRFSRKMEGPTTEWLPSFGQHVAPDAMHTVLAVLLVAALWSGFVALRRWWLPGEETRRGFGAIGR